MKFKIGDKILPKKDGVFSNQRNGGIQTIIEKYKYIDYDWLTNKGLLYKESDIELVETVPKVIEVYGIVKFCKEHYK